ncbi:hypothetical protein, partial [Roseobacter sinensis]
MMEHSQPASQDTLSNVRDTRLSEKPVWDLACGNHQGQRPRAPRKQAGHTSASDKCQSASKKRLAMQELSTH